MQKSKSQSLVVVDAKPVLREPSPAEMVEGATAQAKVLSNLIEKQKLYSVISGRKYVRVEGWVPLARMNGVIPREISNERQEDGSYVARVQLVRLSDGQVLTEASAECGGPGEKMWNDRAPYARRSMAATRATGKACRLAYSWIIALAGFEATPAEEMPKEQRGEPLPMEHDANGRLSNKKAMPFAKRKSQMFAKLCEYFEANPHPDYEKAAHAAGAFVVEVLEIPYKDIKDAKEIEKVGHAFTELCK